MKHYRLIIFILSLSYCITASALEPWQDAISKINYKDSTTIPPFCRINHPDPRYKNTNWTQKFGEDFGYINHFCDAKARIPVCRQYPEKERKACLSYWLEGTSYFFTHNKNPNFPLLPYLYTEHGDLLKEIGRYPEAIQAYNTAIQKNPKYIKAYAMLADTYIQTKQYDDAEQILTEGLKYKDNTALTKRLEKIKTLKK